MAVWSVVHQDPVPPIAQHVGLPRRFAVHGGCHETARVPCPPSTLTLVLPGQAVVPPVFRLPGARQPFAGRRTLFAELAIQHHLLLAARQLRQVGHSYRSVVGFNTTQGGILPV